ncbi:MAG: DUF3850 domain-containing protein [Candidatus Aenigmarchaeota archaeon]|nr:DUF3850 domain-containing protein [Candidatus Aenigmarchaeota archaeon]
MAKLEKKIWPKNFEDVLSGKKKFELGLADFSINPGDTLVLKEWDPKAQKYSGRQIEKKVSYVIKTKETNFYSKKDIEKYGWQVIQID